jgi:MFS transporter, ACS family, D-galactonate transporter
MLGVLGLVWVAAWMLFGREGTLTGAVATDTGAHVERMPYARLISNGTVLATMATGFGAYWGLSLLIGWFTPYLIQGLGFTQREASWITTLPWAASPFIVISAGWWSQRLLARGVSTRLARGVFAGSAVALGGVALIVMPYLTGAVFLRPQATLAGFARTAGAMALPA